MTKQEKETSKKDAEEVENMEHILNVKVIAHVNIGELRMHLRDLLNLIPGSIIEVQKNIEEPLGLSVNNEKEIAHGEVVTVGESLGLRLTEISSENLSIEN